MTETIEIEEWRPCPGYEELYSISDQGRVRRDAPARGTKPGRILRPARMSIGYRYVSLRADHKGATFLVHQLVARAFLPGEPGAEIRHKNGNLADDRLENLTYWASERELRRHEHYLTRHPYRRLSDDDVAAMHRLSAGMSKRKLAERFGVSVSQVGKVLSGRNYAWMHPANRKPAEQAA